MFYKKCTEVIKNYIIRVTRHTHDIMQVGFFFEPYIKLLRIYYR